MDSKEANKVFRERNKARKRVKQCEKALWGGSPSDFGQNQERLKLAQESFKAASEGFSRALKVTLG